MATTLTTEMRRRIVARVQAGSAAKLFDAEPTSVVRPMQLLPVTAKFKLGHVSSHRRSQLDASTSTLQGILKKRSVIGDSSDGAPR